MADSANESSYLPDLETAGYELQFREPDLDEHRLLRDHNPDVQVHVFTAGNPRWSGCCFSVTGCVRYLKIAISINAPSVSLLTVGGTTSRTTRMPSLRWSKRSSRGLRQINTPAPHRPASTRQRGLPGTGDELPERTRLMDVLEAETERLRVAIDAVVPADDFPSASEAGGLRFWSLITGSERPEWADRVIAVLDLLDRRSGGRFAGLDVDARAAVLDGLVDDPDFVWFAQLVNAGFYADPGNGGNDDAVSWRMLGWSPAPAGGWPAEDVWVPDRGPIIRRDQVAARYDAVVVGSGAGGGWRLGRWRSPAGRCCWWSGATTRRRPTLLAIICAIPVPKAGSIIGRCARRRRTREPRYWARTRSSRRPRIRATAANADTSGGGTGGTARRPGGSWPRTPRRRAGTGTRRSAAADRPIGHEEMEPFDTRPSTRSGSAAPPNPTPGRPDVRGRTRWHRCP